MATWVGCLQMPNNDMGPLLQDDDAWPVHESRSRAGFQKACVGFAACSLVATAVAVLSQWPASEGPTDRGMGWSGIHSMFQIGMMPAMGWGASSLNQPEGVVCKTLLHPSIHQEHFLPLVTELLGSENMSKHFDEQLLSECEVTSPRDWSGWDGEGYEGSWDREPITSEDNAILGRLGIWLNEAREQSSEPPRGWQEVLHPGGASHMPETIKRVSSTPTMISFGVQRVLDYGCGDGIDAMAVGREFQLGKEDVFCLDIYDGVAPEAREMVTFLLAEHDNYTASLKNHAETHGLTGSISVIYSMVVFHHISDATMRADVLAFIHAALAPGGIFVLMDWDNPRSPFDYTIYFDLEHDLPALLTSQPAPSTYQLAPGSARGTCYLSVNEWIQECEQQGLLYDKNRSLVKAPPELAQQYQGWLDSSELGAVSVGRNFGAVFSRT